MTDAEIQAAIQALAQLGAAAGNTRGGIAAVGQSMARLRGEMQRGTGTIQQNTQELRKLMTDFDNLDRSAKSSAAGQAMLAEQSRMASQIMRDAAGQMSGALVKGGVIEAVNFFKNQVFAAAESYTSGVSGTTAALRQQQVGLQSNIDILNRLSQGLTVTAEMLALIPNPASRIAAGFSAGGAALTGFFGKGLEAQAEAYRLLGAELSATTIAYQTQTKAGLAYSAGMTEQRQVASVLRLNMGELTNVVTKNKDEMIQFGGSLYGGLGRLKRVNEEFNKLSSGGRSFREQLYRMGISYEEQSQGMIDYIALQASSGQLAGKSQQQLAEESFKYMSNLKAISAYTGEEVKTAQARAKDASEQLAVAEKLRKSGDPKAKEKFEAMVALLPEDMKKAAQQMLVFDGTIVDKNLNILFSQSPTRKLAMDEAFADFQSGMYDTAQLQARQQERMKKYGAAIEQEGLAMGSSFGAVNLATGQYADMVKLGQNQVKEGQKGQNDLIEKLGSTTQQFEDLRTKGINPTEKAFDPLLKSVINLDTKFRDVQMPQYSDAFTESMIKMLTVGGKGVSTLEQQNQDAMTKTLEALNALNLLSNVPSLMQTVDRMVIGAGESNSTMAAASASFTTASNTQLDAANRFSASVDKFGRVPSAATGGVLEGPNSGFLAMLHGREAVIPLGDGNSVNVGFKNPAGMLENLATNTNTGAGDIEQKLNGAFNSPNMMTTALAELKNIMTADSQVSQSLMKQYTEKMDALIASIEDGNRYTREIANNIA